jgi:hypothetical protein
MQTEFTLECELFSEQIWKKKIQPIQFYLFSCLGLTGIGFNAVEKKHCFHTVLDQDRLI